MEESWKSVRLGSVLIVLLTLVVYLPAMRGGFIWDDVALITDNPLVKADDGLYRFWFTTEPSDYYPLTWSLWWLEWRLWGSSAVGYHLLNVLLHAINAVLVWVILKRLRIPGAWLAGLVFAIHPVNVATVAWISEQKNTLSMLFYAVTILLYLRFEEEGSWSWYSLALVAFLLALLSKTAVVMLPVVLLGCVWWMRHRVRWKDFLYSTPFFTLSLVLGLVTIWFQYNRVMGGHPAREVGFLSRLVVAGWVPWFYLYKALLPFNLNAVYPTWNVNTSLWISYLPGLVLVGCLTLFWWRRKTWGRPLIFALGYFVIMLFPVMGFFDQGFYQSSLVSDHWQYYSIVGAIALIVATGMALYRRTSERGQYVGVLASVIALMMLGVATWIRASVWGVPETLWRDTVTKNPDAWAAQHNLGIALAQAGRVEDAIGHYKQALLIKPNFAEAHNDLANALLDSGKVSEAITEYTEALRIKPDYTAAHNNLGNALLRLGSVPEAIAEFTAALRIKPDNAEAHSNLGSALAGQGRIAEAIAEFAAALRIKPDNAEAHYNMGLALASQGRISEAIAEYRETLRLNPDLAPALYELAWILAVDRNASLRNGAEAIQLAERLCAVTGNQQAKALDVLAIAYAEAGQFTDAIRVAQKAIELASAAGQQELAQQVQERLKLYQASRLFREGSVLTVPGA